MIKTITFVIILFYTFLSFAQEEIFDVARKGNVPAMKLVLEQDIDRIDQKNESGFTPLILASYSNNKAIVSYLLSRGARVNILSGMGTALMAATYKGNNDIVKILIDDGADVTISDQKGTTALHYACFFQNTEIVKLIMTKNPVIDTKDDKGKTALDYAIATENIEIIKLLNH